MNADLLERRSVPRDEPQTLVNLVAHRAPTDWLDALVQVALPKRIDQQKADQQNERTI